MQDRRVVTDAGEVASGVGKVIAGEHAVQPSLEAADAQVALEGAHASGGPHVVVDHVVLGQVVVGAAWHVESVDAAVTTARPNTAKSHATPWRTGAGVALIRCRCMARSQPEAAAELADLAPLVAGEAAQRPPRWASAAGEGPQQGH